MPSPKILRMLIVTPALLPVLAQDCGGPDEPTPTPTPDPAFAELADALEAERTALDAPGLAFAWFETREIPYAQGFGTRYRDRGEPIHASTLFRIGSVNKMLTATGVLQQVDDGLVDLDQPLSAYIPDLEFALDPTWADQIHVRHLLDHTGAFYDYLELNADPSDEALNTFITGYFEENIQLLAPPGRMWNYSNPNFMVAGLVTERTTGEFYRAWLDGHVFDPLGMERTYFLADEVLGDGDYAAGWSPSWAASAGASPVVEPDTYDNGWGRPAGYAWSSVLDLARFGQFLMHGDSAVLSDAAMAEMQSAQISTEILGDVLNYGFGLFIYHGFFVGENFYDVTMLQHGGDIPGFAADLYVLPELGYGFAALASMDGAHLDDSVGVALELGDLPAPVEPPDLSPRPETFADCVGHYVDPWNIVGPMDVSLVNGNLQVKMPLLDALRIPYQEALQPYTPDNFILVVQGYSLLLTFLRDENGAVEYGRTRLFVAERDDAGRVGSTAEGTAAVNREGLEERLRRASALDGQVIQLGPPRGRALWQSLQSAATK